MSESLRETAATTLGVNVRAALLTRRTIFFEDPVLVLLGAGFGRTLAICGRGVRTGRGVARTRGLGELPGEFWVAVITIPPRLGSVVTSMQVLPVQLAAWTGNGIQRRSTKMAKNLRIRGP